MKKLVVSLAGTAIVLLLLIGLAGCQMPDQPAHTPPEGTFSHEELLANIDALQGPASRSASAAGRSIFMLAGGEALSTQDLSAYIDAIKTGLASYVNSAAGGSPYLVRAVKVSLPGSNSGLMWVPFTWWRRLSVPIISYQHGTQVFRECAPSRFNPNPLAVFSHPDPTGALQAYVECIVGALMASAGYIVVMPDYPGFGDSTAMHPYVTQSLGDSVRDIVLAARTKLAGGIVRPNGKVFLTGYSEGGYVTMAGARALQQAAVFVTATVPCDGPYDLSTVMLGQMTSGEAAKVPSYLLYTTSGYKAAYPDVIDFTSLLQPDWAAVLTTGNPFDGNHTNAQVGALVPAGAIPRDMLTTYALTDLLVPGGSVYNLLAQNNGWVGWVPMAPVIMIHCQSDDVVPYQNALNAQAVFMAMGVPQAAVPVVEVSAVPFVSTLLGTVHVAAYPTAMLAAFTAIRTVNLGP